MNENEALTASVPLHFVNEDTSPAGKAADVVVTHELKEVTITCLPKDLPESIEVDLGELKAGDVVYLSDIKLPKGVEIPARRWARTTTTPSSPPRPARPTRPTKKRLPPSNTATVPACGQAPYWKEPWQDCD